MKDVNFIRKPYEELPDDIVSGTPGDVLKNAREHFPTPYIRSALIQFIENAVDYGDGGNIYIDTIKEKDETLLIISNDGCGFRSKNDLVELFIAGTPKSRKLGRMGFQGIGHLIYLNLAKYSCLETFMEEENEIISVYVKRETFPNVKYIESMELLKLHKNLKTSMCVCVDDKDDLKWLSEDKIIEAIKYYYGGVLSGVDKNHKRKFFVNDKEITYSLPFGEYDEIDNGIFIHSDKYLPEEERGVILTIAGQDFHEKDYYFGVKLSPDVEKRIQIRIVSEELIDCVLPTKFGINRVTSCWRKFLKDNKELVTKWLKRLIVTKEEISKTDLEKINKVINSCLDDPFLAKRIRRFYSGDTNPLMDRRDKVEYTGEHKLSFITIDEKGKSLSRVRIKITKKMLSHVQISENGTCDFGSIPAGYYVVTASCSGFPPIDTSVSLDKDKERKIIFRKDILKKKVGERKSKRINFQTIIFEEDDKRKYYRQSFKKGRGEAIIISKKHPATIRSKKKNVFPHYAFSCLIDATSLISKDESEKDKLIWEMEKRWNKINHITS